MKKISLSLIAIAAISSAALASSNRSWELRDSPTYCGKFTSNVGNQCAGANAMENIGTTNALAAEEKEVYEMNNFERLQKISDDNDHGRH
jgi:hypothetical protein